MTVVVSLFTTVYLMNGCKKNILVSRVNDKGKLVTANYAPGDPPLLVNKVENQVLNVGEKLFIDFDFLSDGMPKFYWQKDGKNIDGYANEDLIIGAVVSSNEGSYTVTAVNDHGIYRSHVVVISVVRAGADSPPPQQGQSSSMMMFADMCPGSYAEYKSSLGTWPMSCFYSSLNAMTRCFYGQRDKSHSDYYDDCLIKPGE